MKKIWISILMMGICLLSGCSQGEQSTVGGETSSSEEISATKDFFAMDTYMTVTAYGENANEAVDAAEELVNSLDSLWSTGNANSEISILNREKTAEVSDVTLNILQEAVLLNQDTKGVFNIAVYPIMKAWGFTDQNYQVPEKGVLEDLLSYLDNKNISWTDHTVTLEMEEMEIDFGGIAKGYTSAQIMEIYQEHGITSGLVSLGGNVQALGYKPDGSEWRIAVQDPEGTSDYLGVLEIHDKAVITSGGYERYFEEDGETYHHIIDPSTGYPANNGILSSTIISDDGMLADGLSTSLFIMGPETAANYWREHKDEFDAILLLEDGTLYVTEGIADHFTTSMNVEIIR